MTVEVRIDCPHDIVRFLHADSRGISSEGEHLIEEVDQLSCLKGPGQIEVELIVDLVDVLLEGNVGDVHLNCDTSYI